MADPILKWAGGKRQLLEKIYARFPKSFKTYHEPFIGGGALFFSLEHDCATINDTNPRLSNFYLQIKNNYKKILKFAISFKNPESSPDPNKLFHKQSRKGKNIKNYYYQQREIFNNRPYGDLFDPIEEAALLLYLNRTGYNGLYRENSEGGFNVPIGRYKNPDWIQKERVKASHKLLENTEILNQDFSYVLEKCKRGDLIYFDPPYEPMSPTASFNDYSAQGFTMEDQKRLLNAAQELDEDGIFIIMSNSGVMAKLYEDYGFKVDLVQANRAINSDANKRGAVNEIIATNIQFKDI